MSRVFYDPAHPGFVLLTNYKVMATSWVKYFRRNRSRHPRIISCAHLDDLNWKLEPVRRIHDVTKVLVVRDPYARIASFYQHWLVNHVAQAIGNEWELTPQHTPFVPHLKVGAGKREEILEALSKLTFKSFVELLPGTYRQNTHLAPQVEVLAYDGGAKRLEPDRLLRMETLDAEFLRDELNIDVGKLGHENKSGRKPVEYYFDSSSYEIVNRLYEDDFRMFGYTMRT
jgi:hypothetical protein